MAFLRPFSFVLLLVVLILSAKAEEKLWPYDDIDFIVVGAGAAGAAVASRLSERANDRVLLLEAGEEPMHMTNIPYFAPGPFRGPVDWQYETEPSEASSFNFVNKIMRWPRGKALGGSTVINAMMWIRGNRRDYDLWQELGNEGWGFEHVLPYFRKIENYQAPFIHEDDAAYHGAEGPMYITRPPFSTPLAQAFLDAGREMGLPEIDYNAARQTGFSLPYFTLRNGSRWNTYYGYLREQREKRSNLQIVTNAHVTKVIFDDAKRAVGVKFEKDGILWTVKNKKEVILCAGAANSPQILMLSGVGPQETLKKFKIPIVHALPAVGQNLWDHVSTSGMTYTLNPEAGFMHGEHMTIESMQMWEAEGKGPLTVPMRTEGMAFINTRFVDPEEDFPDIEFVMLQPPNFNLGLKPEASASISPDKQTGVVAFIPFVLRPQSVGYISLRSADPHEQPLIQPRFLSDNQDLEILLEGVKFIHKLSETKAFQNLNMKPLPKNVFGCENLERFTDDYFRCLIQHFSAHVFHPMGTCKMGPAKDPMAVVDPRLRVRGVSHLRVIDASITPTPLTAHTMAPSIMIGEKGAAMIIEDWSSNHEEL